MHSNLSPCKYGGISIYLSTYLRFYSFSGLWPLIQFLNPYRVDRAPWTGNQPVARPLPTHRRTQTQIPMPRVGFEPTIPVFERAKTVHALDRAATVRGSGSVIPLEMKSNFPFFVRSPA
jgi:hypothetical protein